MIHESDIIRVRGDKRAYRALWWLLFGSSLGLIATVSLIWGRR